MVLIAETEKYDVRRGPFSGLTVNAKLYQSDAQRFVVVVDGVPWHDRAVARSAELGFDSLADGMAALKDFRVRAAELSQGRSCGLRVFSRPCVHFVQMQYEDYLA